MDGWAMVGEQAWAVGSESRPAAGRNRGLGWRRASQNRDVTPGAWLTRMDVRSGGYCRVQAIPPHSGVTACSALWCKLFMSHIASFSFDWLNRWQAIFSHQDI